MSAHLRAAVVFGVPFLLACNNALGRDGHPVDCAATARAFGIKVPYQSYGMRGGSPLTSLSGSPYSVVREVHEAEISMPFIDQPARFGTRLRFDIVWADYEDLMGGIVTRAHSLNASLLPTRVDNNRYLSNALRDRVWCLASVMGPHWSDFMQSIRVPALKHSSGNS